MPRGMALEWVLIGMQALLYDCLLIVRLECLATTVVIYRFNERFELMTCGTNCLFDRTSERRRRPVACCLIIMKKVKLFYCVVLIEVRCTVTFSHCIEIIAFVDGFFDWLVLLNSVHIYLRC